jgi:putative ABC transport system permease protein
MTFVEMREGISMALSSIRQNKLRAGLTILGVLIGVWSVIAMTSLVKGLDNAVQSSISDLGSNILFVDMYAPNTDWDELDEAERHRKPITSFEANVIMEGCASVTAVSPENHYYGINGNAVKYQEKKANNPTIVGVWPDYIKVRTTQMANGRFFTKLDEETRAMLCIIGSNVKEALFPDEDPLDKQIRINGQRFLVIGTLENKKGLFGGDETNNEIFIPLETFAKLYPWDSALTLAVSAISSGQIETARDEVISVLRKARRVPYNKDNDFAVFGQENIREIAGNITKYIYIAMIVISSVGLMVGGIGVMNIMLVSVTERTREIGVRKAIGARRNNILWQFLIEAMTLTGSGGILGIVAGILTALLIGLVSPLPFGISPLYVSLGFIVSVSVGLVAGMYPAYRAARVDPIESLRYE